MAPVNVSEDVSATPSTIWKTCFAPMKWESWDADIKELTEVSGGCVNGTTANFVMKNGDVVPCVLSEVIQNQSVTFSGQMKLGLIKFRGTVLLSGTSDSSKTHVDYTFQISGCLGAIANIAAKKEIVGGTEEGLKNIVKLSQQAQASN